METNLLLLFRSLISDRIMVASLFLAMVLMPVHPLEASPSSLLRPSLKEILKSQGWDKLADWKQHEEQAEHFISFNDWKGAYRSYGRAVASAQSRQGGVHPLVLRLKAAQARCHLHLNELNQGVRKLREIQKIQQERLGAGHPDVLTTRHWLALSVLHEMKWKEAEVALREIVAGRIKALGAEHDDTMDSQTWLAVTLENLELEMEAEQIWRSVLNVATKQHGEEDLYVLDVRTNLAQCLHRQNQHEQAVTEFREILKHRRKVLGVRHELTLSCWQKLAAALLIKGDFEEAKKEYQAAAEYLDQWLGNEDSFSLIYHAGVAIAMESLGQFDGAMERWRMILDRQLMIFGDEETEEILETKVKMAGMWLQLGKANEAQSIVEQVLRLRTKKLGAEHPLVYMTQRLLAECLLNLQQAAEAEAIYRQIIPPVEKLFGKSHEIPWQLRVELAKALKAQGMARYNEAKDLLMEAQINLGKFFSATSPQVILVRLEYAILLGEMGDLDRLKNLLNMLEEMSAVENRFSLSTRLALSKMALEDGNPELALDVAEKGLKEVDQIYGPKENLPAQLWNTYGNALFILGRFQEAYQAHQMAWQKRSIRLGDQDPQTLESIAEMVHDLVYLNRSQEALSLLDEHEPKLLTKPQPEEKLARFYQGLRASLYARLGRHGESEKLFSKFFEIDRDADHSTLNLSMVKYHRALNHTNLNRLKDAEALLQTIVGEVAFKVGKEHPQFKEVAQLYRLVKKRLGEPDDLQTWTKVGVNPAVLRETQTVAQGEAEWSLSDQVKLREADQLATAGYHASARDIYLHLLDQHLSYQSQNELKVVTLRLRVFLESMRLASDQDVAWKGLKTVLNSLTKMSGHEGEQAFAMFLKLDDIFLLQGRIKEMEQTWQLADKVWSEALPEDHLGCCTHAFEWHRLKKSGWESWT